MNLIGILLGIVVVIVLAANGPQLLEEARSATTQAMNDLDQKADKKTSEVATTVDAKLAEVDAKARELSAKIEAKVRQTDAAVSHVADDLAAKKARAEAELVEKARAAVPTRP